MIRTVVCLALAVACLALSLVLYWQISASDARGIRVVPPTTTTTLSIVDYCLRGEFPLDYVPMVCDPYVN